MRRNLYTIILIVIGLTAMSVIRKDGQGFINQDNWLFFLQILIIALGNLSIKKRVIAKPSKAILKNTPKTEKFIREFTHTPNIVLSGLIVFTFILMGVFLLNVNGGHVIGTFLLILSLTMGVYVGFAYKYPAKVILSEREIKYEDLFTKFAGSWKDISDISNYYGGTDFLTFKKVRHKSPLSRTHFYHGINLSAIDRRWKNREIGKIIKQNAPYLDFSL